MVEKKYSALDLFGIATEEIERSVSSKPNILNYVPYPEQERFHRSTKPGRYVSGGNRGGKTDAIVVDAIWWATNTHPYTTRPEKWGAGPIQIRFIVVDVVKGVEQFILPKLRRWLAPSMCIDGSFDKSWDPRALLFTFANGSTIDFLTHAMDMSKFGGVPRHLIYFDEIPPQNLFVESMMRLIDYDGFWAIAATSTEGLGWTYEEIWEPAVEGDEKVASYVDTFNFSMAQNPYLQAEHIDRFFIGASKEEREIREEGTFVAKSGLIFPSFSNSPGMYVLDEVFIPPKNWDWFTSVDFGFNNPTAWLWHAVGPKGQIITFAEHYQRMWTVPEHAAVVHQMEADFGKVPEIRTGDPAGKQRNGITGTSYITEYADKGIYIGVEGVPHEVSIGIEKMQQYFKFRDDSPWGFGKPYWVINPTCPYFIRELKKLRWASYTSDSLNYASNKQETVHKKDDHAFDSARYFATLQPDLTPVEGSHPTTFSERAISYDEMLSKIAADPNEQWVSEKPFWETEYSYEDY